MNNLTCVVCSSHMTGNRGKRYCSSRCRELARAERDGFTCSECGKIMYKSREMDSTPTCQTCRRARISHGTAFGYRKGCRCDECRCANTARMRKFVEGYAERNGVSPTARLKRERRGVSAETQLCEVCEEPLQKSYFREGAFPAHNACRGRFRIPESERKGIYERDAWMCHLCGEATEPDGDKWGDWFPSVDHVVPRSMGGTEEPENLRTAHRWCNSVRGVRPVEEFQFK